jgi:ABC-2 type transport system ATP-binding protein
MSIVVRSVTKLYGKQKALDNVSFEVKTGEIVGFLGPNGAGKSTLLKLITGLVKPDSGSITIMGENPSWAVNGEISYLPDRAKWYQHHTVEHALSYSSCIFPLFNLEKAREMADSMHLDFKSRVESLSKGQQLCLMLAICLARETKLVLLDEPFSGIDLICRERIIHSIIDSLDGQKQTFIICTHEIYEAESLFEYVVFLDNGQLLKADEAEALRAQGGSIESIYRRLYR